MIAKSIKAEIVKDNARSALTPAVLKSRSAC